MEILVDESYISDLKDAKVNDNHIDDGLRSYGAEKYDMDDSGSFDIVLEFSNTKNVRWRYPDDPNAAEDEKVENAHIYLLNSANPDDIYESGSIGEQSAEGGGDFNLTIGQEYYFLLVPDYGYQINTIRINDSVDLIPQDKTGVFKFEMGNSNFHFKGIVSPTSNPDVEYSGNKVSSPSIEADKNTGIKGNIKMTVEDTTTDMAATSNVTGGNSMTAVSSIDISTYQVISKGPGKGNWIDQKTELDNSVMVSVSLPASSLSAGTTYGIIRKHGDSYEEMDAVYNSSTGRLTFPSDKFSTYTIVKKPGNPEKEEKPSSSSTSTSENKKDENTSTPETKQPAGLGTVAGGSSVKNWSDLDKIITSKNAETAKTNSEKEAAKSPVVVTLNSNNAVVPASTINALQNSDAAGLHLMMGNGTAVTIANGAGLKNQGSVNLNNKITQTSSGKTIAFASNAKLGTVGAIHLTVPTNVKSAKLFYVVNGKPIFLGELIAAAGKVFFPITQLGTYQLKY